MGLGVMRLIRLLTSDGGALNLPLLMLVVTCLLSVGVGILFFWSCIASSSTSLVLWSIMMIARVLLQILSYGLVVLFPRGVSWSTLCVIMLR